MCYLVNGKESVNLISSLAKDSPASPSIAIFLEALFLLFILVLGVP